jgi:hypothetical protein
MGADAGALLPMPMPRRVTKALSSNAHGPEESFTNPAATLEGSGARKSFDVATPSSTVSPAGALCQLTLPLPAQCVTPLLSHTQLAHVLHSVVSGMN